ncbi:MAG: amidohydrolase family protein [Desulfurococcaceae archaeon]
MVTYAMCDVVEGERVAEPRDVLSRLERPIRERGGHSPNLRIWASLRQVMMVSDELMESVLELARRHGLGLILHLGEQQGEVDFTLTREGIRPLEYVIRRGLDGIKPVVIAHGVYFSPSEVRLLRDKKLGLLLASLC